MTVIDEIERLKNLHDYGDITDEEFAEAKARILEKDPSMGERFADTMSELSADTRMWGLFIHLSQFAGYLVPFAGLVAPIIIWQIKKNESDILDQHGKIVANWIITELILGIGFYLLIFVFIGIPLLIALSIAAVAFPIIGAVKAYNDEAWAYPCSFKFFN